jgi:alkylation response protein AidB-like acyl-CoA dehydrogenase
MLNLPTVVERSSPPASPVEFNGATLVGKDRTEGLSVFLVDLRGAKGNGVGTRPIKALINHNTVEFFIENLKAPADNLIGEEGQSFRYILDGMRAFA